MSIVTWRVYDYPLIEPDRIASEVVENAIASRSESGSVYWDAPNPRRSFVRGAVYDHSGRLIHQSQRKGGMNADMVLSVNPPILSQRERAEASSATHVGRWLYCGSWMHGFGHFLVETLPTLWPLLDDADDFDGVCAHRFNSLRTHAWQFELVAMLTDKPAIVIDDSPAQFQTLVVPSRAYHYQVAIAPIAARVWNRVSERAATANEAEPRTPVYLSRTRFQEQQRSLGVKTGREVHNSEDLDRVFADHGFRVVYPEQLTATEQVRLVRSASVLAGASGSALHLSVFAQPHTRVIEVGDARTRSAPVATQRAISAVKQQPIAHIPYAEVSPAVADLRKIAETLQHLGMPPA